MRLGLDTVPSDKTTNRKISSCTVHLNTRHYSKKNIVFFILNPVNVLCRIPSPNSEWNSKPVYR
jgi:hypothetical protein